MNTSHCLKLAGRIDAGLLRELGQGIDLARMLAEPLYARDVLLVCDALGQGKPENELPGLSREFRVAANERSVAADAPATTAPDSGGFSASRLFGTIFGGPAAPPAPPPGAPKSRQRGWFDRGRGSSK